MQAVRPRPALAKPRGDDEPSEHTKDALVNQKPVGMLPEKAQQQQRYYTAI